MRMSDIVSSLGLAVYPIAGMLLFLSVFVGVILHVTARRHAKALDTAATLPFCDEVTSPPSARPATSTRASETKP